MPREITRADYEAVFKVYADKAVKRFNMTRNHPPQLFTVKLGPGTGEIAASGSLNKLAPMFHNGTMHKDQLRFLLQELTTPGSQVRRAAGALGVVVPDIVVQINEMWFVTRDAKSKQEAKALGDLTPSEQPDRRECVGIALHSHLFSTMGVNEIFDKPKRHAVLGELLPDDGGTFVGRLSMTIDDEML
jgi:hypothetical protein